MWKQAGLGNEEGGNRGLFCVIITFELQLYFSIKSS